MLQYPNVFSLSCCVLLSSSTLENRHTRPHFSSASLKQVCLLVEGTSEVPCSLCLHHLHFSGDDRSAVALRSVRNSSGCVTQFRLAVHSSIDYLRDSSSGASKKTARTLTLSGAIVLSCSTQATPAPLCRALPLYAPCSAFPSSGRWLRGLLLQNAVWAPPCLTWQTGLLQRDASTPPCSCSSCSTRMSACCRMCWHLSSFCLQPIAAAKLWLPFVTTAGPLQTTKSRYLFGSLLSG